ncbi:MAG: nucleotide exchange factor GrpE [Acidimicrobiia bacterium]|nr:nucleotide exchange factor GrpE [Acidimicrobiia bacterium]
MNDPTQDAGAALEPPVEAEVIVAPVSAEELGIELPGDPPAAIETLLHAVRDARSEASDHLDRWHRAAADLDNYRKRALREHAQIRAVAGERVISGLLPALDSFQAALGLPEDTPAERLLDGMRGTLAQLMDALGREGFEAIPAEGEPFDPGVHEAVSASADGEGRLVVVHELRRGYRLGGKVLRPALVAVGYEPEVGE